MIPPDFKSLALRTMKNSCLLMVAERDVEMWSLVGYCCPSRWSHTDCHMVSINWFQEQSNYILHASKIFKG